MNCKNIDGIGENVIINGITYEKEDSETIRKTLIKLTTFSTAELCGLYNKLNIWEWDNRLGSKPKGFDELNYYNKNKDRRTKSTFISPLMRGIEALLGEKGESWYWNVCELKHMNDEEFEEWWRLRELCKATGFDVLYDFDMKRLEKERG